MHNDTRITDAIQIAMGRARDLKEHNGIVGYGIVELRGPDQELKQVEPFANLITNVGDVYYATRGVAGIGTPNIAQPTLVSRMKLGTGTTAVAKTGAGAAVVTYISGSHIVFDTTHPQVNNLGTTLGCEAIYKTTWAAGTATNSAITEAVITNLATDAIGTAADVISRVVFSAVNKGASDTLAITWTHKFLGA